MIPILYEANETNFNHNGICSLYGLLDYEVIEARNGEFELELIYPVDGLWFSELTDFRIISAEPNEIDEPHRFRIYEIKKSLDEQTVTVYASTATNDLGGNLVEKVVISDETPQQAMNKMKAALLEPTNYNFVSDIQTKSSTEWERRNPLNCIAGEAGSLIAYWGGEVKRTNDTIYLYSRRGKDNVTTIRPGKNLSGFEMTVSTKGLITAILPYFRYIPENETDYVTVYGTVVRSPLENNYPIHKITPVDFSSDESITTVELLNEKASHYFTYYNPDCDKPKVNLEIDLMQLSDSSEYEKFKSLERIGLTDTVTVWVEKFDIDVVVKVTEVTYNGMKRMVTKLVAGTPSVKFYDDVRNTYQQDINYLKDYIDSMENGVRNQIQLTADGKNTIFRGYTEPSADIAKVNDLWYKQLGGGAVEMMQFDGAYWQPLKVTDDVFAEEMSITKFTAGTLNAELVNLINLNADNITTGTLSGVNFWVNLLTGLMRFIDPATLDTLDLDQAKIIFGAGTIYERILEYTSEGLRMRPGPNNVGTNGNTSLILEGKDGAHKYIDFRNTTLGTTQRLVGINETIRLHTAGRVEFRKNWAFNGTDPFIPTRAGGFMIGDGTEGIWDGGDGVAIVEGYSMIDFRIRGVGVMQLYRNGIACWGDMYMNGHTIWDESDIKLKKNVITSDIDGIAETKKQKIIEFEWDRKNPHNARKPEGRQFGLSAQDSGILQISAEDTGKGYMGVNLIKEIHLATLTNQQIISELESTKKELAALKALLKSKGVI